MNPPAQRMPLIDVLKAVASQLILLHHLSAYGPLPASAQALLPGTLGWLYDYARMAVQVFLVVGGFLAVRGLSPAGQPLAASPWPLLWKRYQRLAIPFLAAVALAIIGSAIADHWLDDEAVPARATFGQWLAHATLLHGILGVESLSAGVWYVAIDFQLFALLVLLLRAGGVRPLPPVLVLTAGVLSLFWFNRDAEWDNWALYFFGAYALGAAAWWAADRRRVPVWLGVIATLGLAAQIVDFRPRIAIAVSIALLLAVSRRNGFLERCPEWPPFAFLGRISYSVFLVHFPVLLLVNALFATCGWLAPGQAIFGLLTAWTASLAAGVLFYRHVESPEASRRIQSALGLIAAALRTRCARLPGMAGLLARRSGRG